MTIFPPPPTDAEIMLLERLQKLEIHASQRGICRSGGIRDGMTEPFDYDV